MSRLEKKIHKKLKRRKMQPPRQGRALQRKRLRRKTPGMTVAR